MSRGFDVDDFRDSDSSRDVGRGASSGWDYSVTGSPRFTARKNELTNAIQEQRERSDKDRPPLPREDRVQAILAPFTACPYENT